MELSPDYKLTAVGVIPEEWEVSPLLSVVRIANGQVDPKVEPYRSMVLLAPDHIESATGRILRTRTAAEQGAISGKYSFVRGDIVYSKIRPYLRKAALPDFDGLCSADMYPLRPIGGVSARYILAVILGHHFSKYAEAVSIRSGMPKINRAELADYSFALPPEPEQCAIAGALSEVDALLDGLERLLAKKRALKRAAMHQLLTGQTRLPGFGGPWEERRLDDLFAFKNGLNRAKRFFGFGKPIVNFMDVMKNPSITSAMLRGRVSLSSGEVAQYEVQRGDVLFTRTSETREEIGMSSVVLDELRDTVFSGFVLRARPKNEALCIRFSAYCFRAPAVRKQIVASASYTTRALTSGRALSAVTVLLPNKPEQTAIATVLSDMDAEMAVLEARLEKTKALKQGMMQELLTGRTRLVAPEPAHA